MNLNPETLSWEAPTQNRDGTPIEYDLEYEVGLENGNGGFEPLVTVVGSLREDKEYTAPIADLALETGKHTIALRSFAADDPDRKSPWSDPVTFTLSDEIPERPLGLRVS